MLLNSLFVVCIGTNICNAIQYDNYSGKRATERQMAYYEQRGALKACISNIEPCQEDEPRRVDGSCNNLVHPVRGTHFEPLRRILPACYADGNKSRLSEAGAALPDERLLRLALMGDGQSNSDDFTTSMTGFPVFISIDMISIHDILNYLEVKTDCCETGHENDEECAAIWLGENDPVYMYSGVKCLNLTKPLTYQHYGCTNDPTPSPIQNATAALDLSQIYNYANKGDNVIRSFVGGMLETEEKNGMTFPPSFADEADLKAKCPLNSDTDKMCFKNYENSQLNVNMFLVWFVRNHNYFAQSLAEVNPCWNDDKLFQVARDMNIAFAAEMYVQEWMTAVIGRENMRNFNLTSGYRGHRDLYDSDNYPTIPVELAYILRWFHVCQQGIIKLFNPDGTHVKDYVQTNLTLATGYLAAGDNMVQLTQAYFRQPSAKIHHGAHYELTHNGLPGVQRAVDVLTSDLKKGRLLGMAPYVDYLEHFFGLKIETFDDLRHFMSEEVIEKIMQFYEHVRDIDLMAGVWTENLLSGGKIPQLLAYIIAHATVKTIQGDRHWYERADRPNAFTHEQLLEIRKSSLATLLCNVGDRVTEIQKHAFFNISPTNPLVSCYEIPNIDFLAWADPACAPMDTTCE